MSILMVLTSHDGFRNTDKKTSLWMEEFAVPYYVLSDAGAQITRAFRKGGQRPLDPKSDATDVQTDETRHLTDDTATHAALATTAKLSEMGSSAFDAVFSPGRHGPLWDQANYPTKIYLIENVVSRGKPIIAVCHRWRDLIQISAGQVWRDIFETLISRRR